MVTILPKLFKLLKLTMGGGTPKIGVMGLLLIGGLVAGCAGINQSGDPLERVVKTAAQLPQEIVKATRPSNDRQWDPLHAKLARAERHGQYVTIYNIRNTEYRSEQDFTVRYYDKTFDLEKLKTVDFIVVPFPDNPAIAHTMLSFGFDDQEYLAVSVETRREKHETYSALAGFFNQYEIIYVLGDERDLIQLRTHHWMNDVYIYRTIATPEQARRLFLDVLDRVNALNEHPEFYNTLTNNCTTNIRRHVNRVFGEKIPKDYRVLVTGYSDRLAYELGLLESAGSFEETRRRARVNPLAYRYGDRPDFSRKIREELWMASR
jgi:hypothetical protein